MRKDSEYLCVRSTPEQLKHKTPMHACIHGDSGTGRSKLIHWITRILTATMGWKHGAEFLSVAFQPRVAYAVQGITLHSGGDMGVGGDCKSSQHTDVDVLFIRNQSLRWLLIGETSMIPDELFGAYEQQLSQEVVDSLYKKHAHDSARMFGGCYLLTLGCLFQIPLIPENVGNALCMFSRGKDTMD